MQGTGRLAPEFDAGVGAVLDREMALPGPPRLSARFAIRDRSHSGAVARPDPGWMFLWERSLTANRLCQARLAFQARFAIKDRSHSGAVARPDPGWMFLWERSLTANRFCQARLAFQARFAIKDRSHRGTVAGPGSQTAALCPR